MLVNFELNALTNKQLTDDAKEKYNEDEEKMKADVEAIKTWISKSPHLESIRQDEIFLRYFLRGCSHSLETTKKRLDMFFTVKSNLPAWFSGWDPQLKPLQEILNAGIFLPLPGFDRKGRAVFLVRFGAIKPGSMKVDDIYKVSIMLLELALEGNTQAGVKGLAIINDIEGVGPTQVAMMTPATMKKHIVVFQEAYPMENQKLIDSSVMHFLNMPKIVETVFNLFLSQTREIFKNMNMIHPKGDTSKLVENVGREILPKDYGGENITVKELTTFWIAEVTKHQEWLRKQTLFKSNESKRTGRAKTQSDIFGIEGSFRKLEID